MTLSFSTQINGKNTYFPEKILHSLEIQDSADKYQMAVIERADLNLSVYWNCYAKKHTIREDKANRWQPGVKIHFVIYNRSPKRYQFAPIKPVTLVQAIEIIYPEVLEEGEHPIVKVDGIKLMPNQIRRLAINDGFLSANEFFEYFNTPFTGKIIHWTNEKY